MIPRPRVAIFSTCDELVELGLEPGPGQIVNSNLQYLIARIHECGCVPIPLGIGEDRSDDLDRLLDRAQEADTGSTPNGRRFFVIAQADYRAGNLTAAIRNLQTAVTYEPGNEMFRETLATWKAERG